MRLRENNRIWLSSCLSVVLLHYYFGYRYSTTVDAFTPSTISFSSSASCTTTTARSSNQKQQQKYQRCYNDSNNRKFSRESTTALNAVKTGTRFHHALAILNMPYTSMDRIANEAVIETVLPQTRKMSVVLRCGQGTAPSTAALRRYVGEVYSQLWDVALVNGDPNLPDVVIYPQNLPNAAPESWIDIQNDLDCVCSLDSIVGWSSEIGKKEGRGRRYQSVSGDGLGGLDEHVQNVNMERKYRNLKPVYALHVEGFDTMNTAARDKHVIFVDDEDECHIPDDYEPESDVFLAGATPQQHLFDSVCCGGTFDGLHFGHRKLLTLAMSSVNPVTGRLLVGVTVDAMLKKKKYAEYIPKFDDRVRGVRKFLNRLAPGMINNVQIVPIEDSFGPPGKPNSNFDALVLSHETLDTGLLLNQHRVQELNLQPLKLLCTRRTESHGMSSTALRKLRDQQKKHDQELKLQ